MISCGIQDCRDSRLNSRVVLLCVLLYALFFVLCCVLCCVVSSFLFFRFVVLCFVSLGWVVFCVRNPSVVVIVLYPRDDDITESQVSAYLFL